MTSMTETNETNQTTQVYRVYIKATAEAIWDAITSPEWTEKYGYPGHSEYELRPGGAYRAVPSDEMKAHGAPEVIIDGEVVEADPPRRLVQTWRMLWDPEMAAEGFTRVTWEIEEEVPGLAKLTVTHDVEAAPRTALQVAGQIPETGGGWSFILSDLKTLLETGSAFQG
jgi:uncharacterized protein YndB with AHSA1/START domain